MSGTVPNTPVIVRVQAEAFDLAAEMAALKAATATEPGAIVTFTGICRSEGGKLAALELEHYPGMAEAEIARIAAGAAERWSLGAVTVVHRYGRLKPGEEIVMVIAAAPHRGAAFEAASFIMDYMKTRAPFWKKEHLVDGTSGDWVAPKNADDDAAAKW